MIVSIWFHCKPLFIILPREKWGWTWFNNFILQVGSITNILFFHIYTQKEFNRINPCLWFFINPIHFEKKCNVIFSISKSEKFPSAKVKHWKRYHFLFFWVMICGLSHPVVKVFVCLFVYLILTQHSYTKTHFNITHIKGSEGLEHNFIFLTTWIFLNKYDDQLLIIHSVPVIRTVRLTGTQLQSPLSGSSLTGLFVIRTTGSPDNELI